MSAHADTLGISVSTSDTHEPGRDIGGYYRPGAALIWVRPDRTRADMAATLAHELAHAVTHDVCAEKSRDVHEVIAESVAYAVCSRFGLDLSLRSVDYVAAWLDDPEAFRVGMVAIHDGAASLIDAIEAVMTDAVELAAWSTRCRRHAADATFISLPLQNSLAGSPPALNRQRPTQGRLNRSPH